MKTSILIVLLATAVTLFSCTSSGTHESVDYAGTDSDMVTSNSDIADQSSLAKTADLNFKVANVPRTSGLISVLTVQYGGMVMHHQMLSNVISSKDIDLGTDSLMKVTAYNTVADMTLKVPTQKLDELMNKIANMSLYVNERKMDIEDKSIDKMVSGLKLNSPARESISGEKFKEETINDQIYKLRIDDAVKYSTVKLHFYQSNTVLKETVADDDTGAYNIPLFEQLKLALFNGMHLFASLFITLVNLWVFVLAALGVWLAYRIYTKKRNLSRQLSN
ncbi:hypothetical protein DJ568_10295 [Mucilaginibacter hurinus]|uniref:DUF4349 domain-containing protein n=1 Tax=Mucilaginibacter hurinus TaxID=2201324 RepID=A0A367GQA9_9SPHI|nr:DUF4349 domain-containing protein [Mucilaginibacter hurinus]RCH54861.1 hypothetical protein DJ568_10295 [Mucilaginibacter hurinus]